VTLPGVVHPAGRHELSATGVDYVELKRVD
jgi:hypothetical protein